MTKTTFKAFKDKVRALAFPTGEARNLRTIHDTIMVDALIEVQKFVECLQQRNTSVIRYCSTFFDCGKTVAEQPEQGIIRRVYTIANDEYCDRVYYRPTTYREVECWARNLLTFTSPTNDPLLPALSLGVRYASEDTDSEWGRSRNGIWSLHRNRVVVAPWLQSNEKLVLEWDGIKTTWNDDDLISADPQLVQTVKYYLMAMHHKDYDCDMEKAGVQMQSYREALGNMVWWCREQTRLQQNTELCDSIPTRALTQDEIDDDAAPEETSLIFANIGDYGDPANGTAEADVAAMVKSWDNGSTFFITTNGDNVYSPATLQTAVLDFFEDYIEKNDFTRNRLWVAKQNHDWEDVALVDWEAVFRMPNNNRYFDIVKGPVHIFFLNDGLNSAGSNAFEPDGNSATSIQAIWLKTKLALSTAPFKMVIIGSAPYTSEPGDYPGFTQLRWPFKIWGADAVVSGDSHFYERLEVDGLPYIINGAGGRELDTFNDPVNEFSQFRYNTDHGAIKATASCTELKLEFFSRSGTLIDTLTLTKP